ncbi:uncharacterized protein LOC121509013 [Cheilinus undulatus]|uniref:uncharacterized protein LOC121509013 n=1 Tax=Cheilinus undulatus TaxID=241271 RepID=UPI001BD21EE6|nr:uncharacterized protein LOC121509013 [Cheilinus undulatus]
MMGSFQVAVVVLCLLSVGRSAPVTDCNSLLQPIEIQGREQLLGRWTMLAESTDVPGSKLLTNMFVERFWLRLSAANESDAIDVFQSQEMQGNLIKLRSKATLNNNTLSSGTPLNSTARLLSTSCPDCLVLKSQYFLGQSMYSGAQLLTKRAKVSNPELAEFRKQVQCLNLPPPVILNRGEGLCTEESSVDTDLTQDLAKTDPKVFSMLDQVFKSDNGTDTLVDLISSGISGLQNN